ncbi:MAG: plasmid pRiA4b ORF-3 family protein [Acidobacteria bacterium]|nr:plasmid pRiA4b ORF-3 family protein [Acidobacteriota bacterium]
MKRSRGTGQWVYVLKIVLRGVRPPVWRRVQAPGSVRLSMLHEVIQTLFGWTDTHLHLFQIGTTSFGQPDDFDEVVTGEDGITLAQALGKRVRRFSYVYDFGNHWVHDIDVEKVLTDSGGERLLCLAGRRHRPPEDCGGPRGYAEFLAAWRNPRHPEHVRERPGGSFDPEEFDIAAVTRSLARLTVIGLTLVDQRVDD